MRTFALTVVAAACGVVGGCAEMRPGDGAPHGTDGAYVVERVNGAKLPAATWTRAAGEERCTVETLAGVLLLDSSGRWSGLVTQREAFARADGSRRDGPENSSLFSGTYAQSGARLALKDEALGTEDAGGIDGDVIVLKSVGIGGYAGQTATYVARRMR
jgi:hypothetical protein